MNWHHISALNEVKSFPCQFQAMFDNIAYTAPVLGRITIFKDEAPVFSWYNSEYGRYHDMEDWRFQPTHYCMITRAEMD